MLKLASYFQNVFILLSIRIYTIMWIWIIDVAKPLHYKFVSVVHMYRLIQ